MNLLFPSLTYVLAYIGIGAILMMFYAGVTESLLNSVFKRKLTEKEDTIFWMVMLIWICIGFMGPYYTL